MSGPVTMRRRGLRAVTFAVVLTASAVLAHVLAGGMAPGATVIALSAAAMLAAGWALSGRDRPTLALATAAGAGEVALHTTFCLAMPGRMSLGAMLCGTPTHPMPPGVARMQVTAPGPAATSHTMLLMMLAHAVAGVVVLLALRSVEALAAAVVGAMTAVLLWSLPTCVVPAVRRVRTVAAVLPPATASLLVVSPRRGPPAVAA